MYRDSRPLQGLLQPKESARSLSDHDKVAYKAGIQGEGRKFKEGFMRELS